MARRGTPPTLGRPEIADEAIRSSFVRAGRQANGPSSKSDQELMWTYEKALRVVTAYVDAATDGGGVVLENETIDKPYGWVFFYQSRAFIKSGRATEAYAGNAPLIFNRVFGEYHVTGTAKPIELYIKEYESALPAPQLAMKPQIRQR